MPVLGGNAEQLGDDGDRERLCDIGEQVELGPGGGQQGAGLGGRNRSTWPRPKALATRDRSRVCTGGSFSIIWLRCNRLNGS